MDSDEGIIVGELEHLCLAQRDVQILAHILSQTPVGVSGKYFEFVEYRFHHLPSYAGLRDSRIAFVPSS